MPRLPQLGTLLGCRRPAEIIPAIVDGDRLYRLRLFRHAAGCAVKLKEKGGRLFVIEF